MFTEGSDKSVKCSWRVGTDHWVWPDYLHKSAHWSGGDANGEEQIAGYLSQIDVKDQKTKGICRE